MNVVAILKNSLKTLKQARERNESMCYIARMLVKKFFMDKNRLILRFVFLCTVCSLCSACSFSSSNFRDLKKGKGGGEYPLWISPLKSRIYLAEPKNLSSVPLKSLEKNLYFGESLRLSGIQAQPEYTGLDFCTLLHETIKKYFEEKGFRFVATKQKADVELHTAITQWDRKELKESGRLDLTFHYVFSRAQKEAFIKEEALFYEGEISGNYALLSQGLQKDGGALLSRSIYSIRGRYEALAYQLCRDAFAQYCKPNQDS